MPRENIHYGGWEHRDLHNINGMLFVSAWRVWEIAKLYSFVHSTTLPRKPPWPGLILPNGPSF